LSVRPPVGKGCLETDGQLESWKVSKEKKVKGHIGLGVRPPVGKGYLVTDGHPSSIRFNLRRPAVQKVQGQVTGRTLATEVNKYQIML